MRRMSFDSLRQWATLGRHADVGVLTVRGSGEMGLHHGNQVRLGPQAGKLYRFGADGKAL